MPSLSQIVFFGDFERNPPTLVLSSIFTFAFAAITGRKRRKQRGQAKEHLVNEEAAPSLFFLRRQDLEKWLAETCGTDPPRITVDDEVASCDLPAAASAISPGVANGASLKSPGLSDAEATDKSKFFNVASFGKDFAPHQIIMHHGAQRELIAPSFESAKVAHILPWKSLPYSRGDCNSSSDHV